VIELIDEACTQGARRDRACALLGLSVRTLQRWRREGEVVADGRLNSGREPVNKLSAAERARVLAIANSAPFCSLAPSQIVPALADQGEYVASESSFYRILREADQLAHRGRAKPRTHQAPKAHSATQPNRLWSWDITYLATTVQGLFFYLYLIMDVYSRKIVGWEVYESESSDYAGAVFRNAYLREGVAGETLVLHSDNGSPMKGATMLATLQRLGVMPSFSRPSVSDDNPYSEALFKTLKYHPVYPSKPFETLDQARDWVLSFVQWYNEEHRHSALQFVTPGQRHRGEAEAIIAQRQAVYEAAKQRHPERWSGQTRDWSLPAVVWLNPAKPKPCPAANEPSLKVAS
jgi:transposase InsO family protein